MVALDALEDAEKNESGRIAIDKDGVGPAVRYRTCL
jgi:hypothetical protein